MSIIKPEELNSLIYNVQQYLDRRLVTVNHFEFPRAEYVPATLSEHRARRSEVIRRLKLAAGLEPMVEFSKKEPQITHRRIYEGVAIYDVEIETLPGLRLTGNLFMPEKFEGKIPAILCPHGHWESGRVAHTYSGGVSMRCFEFARMGCLVFAYDMVGYNENNDIVHYLSYEDRRTSDLYGVSTFGMQTANSMRAVDFIYSLPETDRNRIICTGASGGASQTWFIAALDKRIKAVIPVCMLSSHFQGGCCCEEGPLLRINGLTSFDIVASLAPMPILLPCVTGDWTSCNHVYEIPKLREVYKLYNAEDKVESFYLYDGHNYNQRTREYVYAWISKHFLGKDCGLTIPEEKIAPPSPEILWFNGSKPEPASKERVAETLNTLKKVYTKNVFDHGDDFEAWRENRRELLREMISSDKPTKDVVRHNNFAEWKVDGGIANPCRLSRREIGDAVCGDIFISDTEKSKEEGFLFIAPDSYKDMFPEGKYYSCIREFLQNGISGYGIELLGGASTVKQFKSSIRNDECTAVKIDHEINWSASAFVPSYFSMRVQDIVTAYNHMKEFGFKNIKIVAPAGSAPEALAACALLNTPAADIDLTGVSDEIWFEKLRYQPLIFKFGGIRALLMVNKSAGVRYFNVPAEFQDIL
ncbi:MAG: acetylxylan esterase [Lentisphaeria bacterium]|nr:acetylxylan esterase [Lentisphaeria bacterium]